MSLRPLFSVLIGIAMLFAPLAISSGQAMAMPSAPDHHTQAMEQGHCTDQPADRGQGTASDKSCCPAMCSAIATAPTMTIEPYDFAQVAEPRAPDQLRRSFLAELPTPPPRLA